jgi:transcriptional regulator of aromatic amino acid metabolism
LSGGHWFSWRQRIDIPPLREHKEDIPGLVNHFMVGKIGVADEGE